MGQQTVVRQDLARVPVLTPESAIKLADGGTSLWKELILMTWELDLLFAVSSYLYTAFDTYEMPEGRKYGRVVVESWSCQHKDSTIYKT